MKAIALDMYGVIMRQDGNEFPLYVQQFFPQLTLEEIQRPWSMADKGMISSLELFAALGFTGDLEKVDHDYLDTIGIMPGAIDFLRTAHERFQTALISNDASRWSHYIRGKWGLNPYFDVITVSGDVKICKPDPRIFELTLKKLGVFSEECLYVDDRPGNLEAARNLGLRTVMMGSQPGWNGERVENFVELSALVL